MSGSEMDKRYALNCAGLDYAGGDLAERPDCAAFRGVVYTALGWT